MRMDRVIEVIERVVGYLINIAYYRVKIKNNLLLRTIIAN